LVPIEDRQVRAQAVPNRVFLRCDDKGCTLSSPNVERRFLDLQTALDCARLSRDTKEATIEVWQGSQYICCVTPKSWQHSEPDFQGIAARRLVSDSMLIAAERHANRAARILVATAGPLFWLALIVVGVAACLGWRLLLL
ncbi:MAG TPA: hypothetical protein VN808_17915, partial [Stellaceae bacterium]|nr:hypothetical protein [Stellaceae bacterium]